MNLSRETSKRFLTVQPDIYTNGLPFLRAPVNAYVFQNSLVVEDLYEKECAAILRLRPQYEEVGVIHIAENNSCDCKVVNEDVLPEYWL